MSGDADVSESNKSIGEADLQSIHQTEGESVENVNGRSDLQSNQGETETTGDENGTSGLAETVDNAIDRLSFQTRDRVEPEIVEVTAHREIDVEKTGSETLEGSQSQDVSRSGPPGGRTYTMKELLDELKERNPETIRTTGAPDAARQNESPSYIQEAAQQHNVAMDLINSVTGVDEEGRSRQRILSFAAKRYATALEKNPEDYDALYNWALVLQESADNVGPDSSAPSKDALLEEACKKYDEATRICPTLHDAFYNWAIAISDRAKMRGRTKEAEELWKQATKNYERAVQLNWNSPQALNNWGLALQELSAIVPLKEKQTIVRTAISKFRAAIRLQFDFHRAIYNLGTVLYGLAEDTLRTGQKVSTKEIAPDELYSQSAIYIAAAHALKPNYSVYRSALRLVHSMLPLPYLKVGYLLAPPAGNSLAPHGDWRRTQFILNHEGLQQVNKIEQGQLSQTSSRKPGTSTGPDKSLIRIDIADIYSLSPCSDLTLPPGAGLCIDTTHGPQFFVTDTWESLDGWIDGIRLVYTIYARGRSETLASVITG